MTKLVSYCKIRHQGNIIVTCMVRLISFLILYITLQTSACIALEVDCEQELSGVAKNETEKKATAGPLVTSKTEYLAVSTFGVVSPSAGQVPGDNQYFRETYGATLDSEHGMIIPPHLAQEETNNTSVPLKAQERIEFVYRRYEEMEVGTQDDRHGLTQVDQQLDPLRLRYTSFDTPDGEIKSVVRTYDGSEAPLYVENDFARIPIKTQSPAKLPIQIENPRLRLKGKYKLEAGRSAKDSQLSDVHLKTMLAFAIQPYYRVYGDELVVYAECLEDKLLGYLEKYEFEIQAGTIRPELPEELKSRFRDDFQLLEHEPNQSHRFILVIPKIGQVDWFREFQNKSQWPSRQVPNGDADIADQVEVDARQAIHQLVGNHPEDPIIQRKLVEMLSNSNAAIRRNAAYTLELLAWPAIAAPETLFALAELLKAKEPSARAQALDIFIALRPNNPIIQDRIAEVLSDKYSQIRQLAAAALGETKPQRTEIHWRLVKLLKDRDWRVRESALYALGEIRSKNTVIQMKIAKRLQDRDVRIQSAAAGALSAEAKSLSFQS